MTGFLKRRSLRSTLICGYGCGFLLSVVLGGLLLYFSTRPAPDAPGTLVAVDLPVIIAAVLSASLPAVILFLVWRTVSSITLPLEQLDECLRQGAVGDYSCRMDAAGPDELVRLAENYNQFMIRLEESRANLRNASHNYHKLFENAVEGIYRITGDGIVLSANPSLAAILGYDSAEDLLGSVGNVCEDLSVHPGDRDAALRLLQDQGSIIDFELQLSRKDGEPIWASINARGTLDEEGGIKTIEGFLTDITQRRNMAQTLVRAKVELESRVEERTAELTDYVERLETRNREQDALQEMIALVQECNSLAETYPVLERFLVDLFPGDQVSLYMLDPKTRDLLPVFSGDASKPFREDQCWALQEGKLYLLGTSGKRPRCAHVTAKDFAGSLCAPLTAHNEHIGLLHVLFRRPRSGKGMRPRLASNIASHLGLAMVNLKLRESLRLQSIQDPLTGLFNRRYLDESLVREFSRADRRGCTCAVLMVDLDLFKRVNDEHGHDIGDLVLQSLAEFLRANTRSVDIPCRYGGEEFAVIMNELTPEEAKAKAEELCKGIREHVRVRADGLDLRVTASIGVALYPLHGKDGEEVLKASDEALYQAKDGGRDQVALAD